MKVLMEFLDRAKTYSTAKIPSDYPIYTENKSSSRTYI